MPETNDLTASILQRMRDTPRPMYPVSEPTPPPILTECALPFCNRTFDARSSRLGGRPPRYCDRHQNRPQRDADTRAWQADIAEEYPELLRRALPDDAADLVRHLGRVSAPVAGADWSDSVASQEGLGTTAVFAMDLALAAVTYLAERLETVEFRATNYRDDAEDFRQRIDVLETELLDLRRRLAESDSAHVTSPETAANAV